jgi:hypothetical protein
LLCILSWTLCILWLMSLSFFFLMWRLGSTNVYRHYFAPSNNSLCHRPRKMVKIQLPL